MSKFIVRVELHGASDATYDKLHKKMEDAGYYRQIPSDTNGYYYLPPATYRQQFAQDYSSAEVRDHVKPIVDGVWSASAVLVTKYSEASWTGLPAVSSRAA